MWALGVSKKLCRKRDAYIFSTETFVHTLVRLVAWEVVDGRYPLVVPRPPPPGAPGVVERASSLPPLDWQFVAIEDILSGRMFLLEARLAFPLADKKIRPITVTRVASRKCGERVT